MARGKLTEERKKKKLSTTVNADLYSLYEKFVEKKGIKKTTEIEKFLKKAMYDEKLLKDLIEEDIIIDDTLLKELTKNGI